MSLCYKKNGQGRWHWKATLIHETIVVGLGRPYIFPTWLIGLLGVCKQGPGSGYTVASRSPCPFVTWSYILFFKKQEGFWAPTTGIKWIKKVAQELQKYTGANLQSGGGTARHCSAFLPQQPFQSSLPHGIWFLFPFLLVSCFYNKEDG